jgi:hypothetical protein
MNWAEFAGNSFSAALGGSIALLGIQLSNRYSKKRGMRKHSAQGERSFMR